MGDHLYLLLVGRVRQQVLPHLFVLLLLSFAQLLKLEVASLPVLNRATATLDRVLPERVQELLILLEIPLLYLSLQRRWLIGRIDEVCLLLILFIVLLKTHVVVSICHVPIVIIVGPELRRTACALVLMRRCGHQVVRRAHLVARNLALILLKASDGVPLASGWQRVVELAVVGLPKHQIVVVDEWVV